MAKVKVTGYTILFYDEGGDLQSEDLSHYESQAEAERILKEVLEECGECGGYGFVCELRAVSKFLTVATAEKMKV